MSKTFSSFGGETSFQSRQELRLCDHPDCGEEGLHKAPKSKENLRDYYWFCLEHVREYNAAWNYCSDMTADEIDGMIREDVTWGRPTWPIGMMGGKKAYQEQVFDDPFGAFDAAYEDHDASYRANSKSKPATATEAKHYRTMRLRPPVTLTALKARYKELAKRLHPDVNGGDKDAEERLKEINEAYTALKKTALRSQKPSP